LSGSRIKKLESWSVCIPRDYALDRGGAGSPSNVIDAGCKYSRAENYGTIYSRFIETTLVKVTTDDGIVGWGEAQAPVAPEIAQSVITHLLGPLLLGQDISSPVRVQNMLYDAMRVRGHSGGFYIDAVSAVDCALWDILGKRCGQPVYHLLGGPVRERLPLYISGLPGKTAEEQMAKADEYVQAGVRAFKVFMTGKPSDCLVLVESLRRRYSDAIEIFVDALWRLDATAAIRFARALATYEVGWLEAPLIPEDVEGHRRLAEHSPIRIALGESYRTAHEILPFLEARAVQVLQPDLGRSGITEGMKIASLSTAFHVSIAPHVSIGLGPQIATAIHCASSWPNLMYVECNPSVFQIADRFQTSSFKLSDGMLSLPIDPGLGVEPIEGALEEYSTMNVVE
jgi:D-galactarolactone cycloisomerase